MAKLREQLEAFWASLLQRVDAPTSQAFCDSVRTLADRQVEQQALRAGDVAPGFSLRDQEGRVVTLAERIAERPVVLMFVRGGWCPFCTLTLRAYEDALPAIRAAGGDLLALSPQPLHACCATAEQEMLSYPLLHDKDNGVADKYGVTYELDERIRPFYLRLGHDLPRLNGTGNWRVPLPASFIIERDGTIALAHVQPYLERRLEPEQALVTLRELGRKVLV